MSDGQLTETKAQQLRKLAGQLNWTSPQTRPDISYQACAVIISIKNAIICDLKTAKKYICKPKRQIWRTSNGKIICFSDASFANLKSGSSQGGFITFMCAVLNMHL